VRKVLNDFDGMVDESLINIHRIGVDMNLNELSLPNTTQHTPVKLFSDASHNHDNGISTAGWVFADHNGAPIETASQNLGKGYSTVQAEKEAAIRGLDIIRQYTDAAHVIVYMDSYKWIPREENSIADSISRCAMESPPVNTGTKYGISD
jgi:ribonuclease HI